MTKTIARVVRRSESPRRSTLRLWCGPLELHMDGARFLKTLRLLQAQQALAHHEEVGQRTGDDQAMPVLRQAAVAHLSEAEHALDHPNGMLDSDPDPRLPPIRGAAPGPAMREVPGVGRADTQHAGLPRIRRIAPDASFLTMQQPRQDVTVMDVGRRYFDRVNELALAVDPEVAFHAEVPLSALLRLMHGGVARAGRILCGRGRRDDCGVHDGAGADGQPLRAPILGDLIDND